MYKGKEASFDQLKDFGECEKILGYFIKRHNTQGNSKNHKKSCVILEQVLFLLNISILLSLWTK